jgi:hypothetical protein
MTDRQNDMYRQGANFLSIPKYIPGRQCGDDFLYFKWCNELEPYANQYTVVIESLDTSGATYRGISTLRQTVELPPIHLPSPARMALIPNTKNLPMFVANLVRGSLYVIPETGGVNGVYQMDREGMLRLN